MTLDQKNIDQEKHFEKISLDEKSDHLALVRRWGDTNTDGILDPLAKTFSISSIDGFIGYRLMGKTAIVLGDPVCSPSQKMALAKAFQEWCNDQHVDVIYSLVSKTFAEWGIDQFSGVSIEFGQKLFLNTSYNPLELSGPNAMLMRQKIKRAIKENVVIQEYTEENSTLQHQMENVASDWLKRRKGAQIYMSQLYLFENMEGKRWFYAKQGNKIVGILLLSQLQASNSWLLNHVMTTHDAPKGTSEWIIFFVMQQLKNENCLHAIVGPIPKTQLGAINGLNPISILWIRFLYRCSQWIFHLSGHEAYWSKFETKKESVFLFFPKKGITFSRLKALLKAFHAGS